MPLQSVPYTLLLGFLFGSTLIVSRFSVGQYDPTNYVALRLVMASLGYIGIYIFSGKFKWPRNSRLWLHAALIGMIGTAVPMTAIVSSMQYQSSGLTSVLITGGPALTVLMAHFALPDEKMNLRKIIGVLLALGGSVLIAILGESGLPGMEMANPLGYLLVLVGLVIASANDIYIRKYLQNYEMFDISSLRTFFAAIALVPLTWFFIGFDLSQVNSQGYIALGYASLAGTFLGTLLSTFIVQRFGATAAAMTTYIIPVITSLGGAWMLKETITLGMVSGMILIVFGVVMINRRSRLETV